MSSQTKEQIEALYKQLKKLKPQISQDIITEKHIKYLKNVLHGLKQSILHFDVAQSWIYYYIIHSIAILDDKISLTNQQKQMVKTAIKYTQNCNGGFGGGYLQQPHLAPTYASFLSILSLGPQYFDVIDKQGLYNFFKKCKKGGRFQMHIQGQCDLRGSYIVIIITKLLGLKQDILQGIAQTIIQSQTHEGGIANIIGGQAHGGFTFCGVAGLAAMGQLHKLNISRLMYWLSHRQVQFGGFNGRTFKLLDSCYSFWIGSVFNIVNDYFKGKCSFQDHLLYCQQDLKKYVVLYCQDRKTGGFFDKPGKPKDIYHTCYGLSGLSLCLQKNESYIQQNQKGKIKISQQDAQDKQEMQIQLQEQPLIELTKIDPIYNVSKSKLQQARTFFSKSQ